MGVGDDGPIDRLPGIDEEVAGLAVEARSVRVSNDMMKSKGEERTDVSREERMWKGEKREREVLVRT